MCGLEKVVATVLPLPVSGSVTARKFHPQCRQLRMPKLQEVSASKLKDKREMIDS